LSLLRGPAGRRKLTNLGGSEGAQLVELAVILPLLMVVIVGIFDFSQAFNLKQKLGSAAFLGARVGSSEPTTDFSQATPTSVTAIRDVVDTYLKRADIDDCGLSAISASASPPLTWNATGTSGGRSGSTFTLTIQRGYTFPATVTGVAPPSQVNVVATQVTISYPYRWSFNRVIGVLVSGASYAGPSLITTTAIVPNQD
jgi:Flp pilus assembly protein TadG